MLKVSVTSVVGFEGAELTHNIFLQVREYDRTGARTRRPLKHQLLHPQILTDQISENPSMYVGVLYVALTFIDRNQFLANRWIL